MIDYQFISFQDVAPLREVAIADIDVPTLDIRGQQFADVVSILINGQPSPEYVVVSRTRILAEIPLTQRGRAISTVQVRTSSSGRTPSAIIAFDVGVNRQAAGWLKLAQSVLKVLLTTPGSDIFSPSLGGGLYRIVGSTGNEGEFLARASLSVQNTHAQVLAAQAEESGLSRSEKLREFSLLEARFDKLSTTLSLRVRITASDGTTSEVSLNL